MKLCDQSKDVLIEVNLITNVRKFVKLIRHRKALYKLLTFFVLLFSSLGLNDIICFPSGNSCTSF